MVGDRGIKESRREEINKISPDRLREENTFVYISFK
jgi:hypothetical protein